MTKTLILPTGENLLQTAFRERNSAAAMTADAAQALYAGHFVAIAQPISAQAVRFEKFSLVDPSIRTTVASNTKQPG